MIAEWPLRKGLRISTALLAVAISLIHLPRITAQPRPPVVYTTPAKLVEALFKSAKSDSSHGPIKLEGRASYTLTAAADDDSLRGTFTLALLLPARATIAGESNAKVTEIPESFSRPDTIGRFEKGTSCPTIELDFPEFEIKAPGGTLVLSGKLLEIHESADRLVQQICFWTRQINVKRERIGIIRSINRMIEGDKTS